MQERQENDNISCERCIAISTSPHTHDQQGNPVKFCDNCYNYYPYEEVHDARWICLNVCDACIAKNSNILETFHEFWAMFFTCGCCLKKCDKLRQRHFYKEINRIFICGLPLHLFHKSCTWFYR